MKKRGIKNFLIAFAGLISFSFVSAFDLGYFLQKGSNDVINMIKGFAGPFFEALLNTSTYDQLFFSKVLVLILLFVIIFSVTKKLKFIEEDQIGLRVIIAGAISIIGMRYISDIDFVQAILLPYGVLAIAVSLGITFIIFGFFINDLPSGGARRLGWIIYIAIFLGMWYDRFSELSRGANLVYALIIGFATLSIMFDRKIHEYLGLRESREAERVILQGRLADIEANLQRYAALPHPTPNITKTILMLEKAQKAANKKLSKL